MERGARSGDPRGHRRLDAPPARNSLLAVLTLEPSGFSANLEFAGNFLAVRDIPRVKAGKRLSMTTDEGLMLEFQQGSREAFQELFERYRDPLYGFFRRRLDHPARAEELAQECWLAVLRNAGRYEPRGTFRSYLYGIAVHVAAAERRKAGREISNGRIPDPAAGENSDAALWVRRALERLAKGEREILMLREYEQLSYAEIAALLRLPVNTVRSRLFRARVTLKEQLIPERDIV